MRLNKHGQIKPRNIDKIKQVRSNQILERIMDCHQVILGR